MKVKNEKGEEVEVSTLAAETGVVIFTAPKADTRELPVWSLRWKTLLTTLSQAGCNKQACHFRDSTAEFTKLGYTVYGLTADTPAALTKWQTKNTLGYTLLSDPKRDFIKALGAKSQNSTKRSHFVFEKGTGKLLDVKLGVKPDDRFVLSVP
jgi:peroxiredoxin Q/BCP